MGALFEIEMFPAREGDCLVVTYGDAARPRRILIDLGRAATYDDFKQRFAVVPAEDRAFELLIVTHVDRDHIEGTLGLIDDSDQPFSFNDVWFNGYHHLKSGDYETFGAVQGERLTDGILHHCWPWNRAFDGGPIRVGDSGIPTCVDLADGMRVCLLSPDKTKLEALEPRWKNECEKAGIVLGHAAEPDEREGFERLGPIDIDALAASPFVDDTSEPNGSSIAVLAEFDGKRALLAGDSHVGRLHEELTKLVGVTGEPISLNVFKIPHHGSKHNLSRELLELVDCSQYLISTNGSYFDHPDAETIARIIKFGGDNPCLCFNYRSPETGLWDNRAWRDQYGYESVYPDQDGFLKIAL